MFKPPAETRSQHHRVSLGLLIQADKSTEELCQGLQDIGTHQILILIYSSFFTFSLKLTDKAKLFKMFLETSLIYSILKCLCSTVFLGQC